MITRKSLADEIDQYDQQIADMNSGKKDCFEAYRNQLFDAGVAKPNIKIEIEAVKAAIKRRRASEKDPTALEEKDALTDEIFWEITSAHAPRTHVENIEEFSSYAQAKLVEKVASGLQTETGRKALIAAVDIMIEREEHIDPETGVITESLADLPSDAVSERAATLVDVSASAEAAIEGQPSLTAATSAKSAGEAVSADLPTNSPETANEMDRTAEGSFETGSEVAENARKAIPAVGSTLQEDGDVTHAGAGESPATNSEITPDPRPLTDADGHPRIPSSSPGCAKRDGLLSIAGQGRESENCITGNQEEQAVDQFTPPAFLKAASEGPKVNPQCQKAAKGEKCTFSHSMASCWRCTDSAMKEKSAASKRVPA